MVNKAYAMVHWQQDFDAAEKLCKEAFERDPGCDTAAATLAQVSLTKSKIDDAIYWFEKHLKIARSDVEIVNTIQCEWPAAIVPEGSVDSCADLEASKAQKEFMATYPEYAARLSQIAQNVQ
jgi:import receptor subunit TOM70